MNTNFVTSQYIDNSLPQESNLQSTAIKPQSVKISFVYTNRQQDIFDQHQRQQLKIKLPRHRKLKVYSLPKHRYSFLSQSIHNPELKSKVPANQKSIQSQSSLNPKQCFIFSMFKQKFTHSSNSYLQPESLQKQSVQNKRNEKDQINLRLNSIKQLTQSFTDQIKRMRSKLQGQMQKSSYSHQFPKQFEADSKKSLLDTDYKSFKQSLFQNSTPEQKLNFGNFKEACHQSGTKYFVSVDKLPQSQGQNQLNQPSQKIRYVDQSQNTKKFQTP